MQKVHALHTHCSRTKATRASPAENKSGFYSGFSPAVQLSPVFPSVALGQPSPKHPPQDPAQVFLESISGMLGMGSILELSPVLQHPVVEVNHQPQWLYSKSCPALCRALQLVGAIVKSQVRCKADFFFFYAILAPAQTRWHLTTQNAQEGALVSAPNRYKKAWEVLGCRERLSALQTMIKRVEICFVCFSLTPGLQSRKMRTSCTHVNYSFLKTKCHSAHI